jgi:hypothetical protein
LFIEVDDEEMPATRKEFTELSTDPDRWQTWNPALRTVRAGEIRLRVLGSGATGLVAHLVVVEQPLDLAGIDYYATPWIISDS